MKKVTRFALVCAGALALLLAVAFLAVNLYVQSHGTQAWIEQELSTRLGTTLKIRRISVTPWWGLKLTGITMPQGDASVPGSFLQADSFRLRVRLVPLFSRRLVIKEIALVNPEVIWIQNANGKWRLPTSLPVVTEPVASAESAPVESTIAAPAPSSTGTSPSVSEPVSVAPASFKPEVRRVYLANGFFRFLDGKQKPVATFEGVRFRSNFRSATDLNGTVSIARTSLRDRFFLADLTSAVTYDPGALDLSTITAHAAGGDMVGSFTMHPTEADSPFTVMIKFRDLDADRVLSDAHGPMGMLQGKLEGHLDATGQIADPNALHGEGEISLRGGQVRRYSLLVALGQLLQIDELMQLKLDQAHVKYHITPGVVTVDELLFASPNLRLSATGTVTFAGDLQLEAQLAINERIRRQLFATARENFKPIDLPGYTAVEFQVTGTVDHPKTNLMDKVVGEGLRDLGGVIDSLFGRKAKRKKMRAESAPEVTPAEPAPTPEISATP